MNEEIKIRWVNALESGDYPQVTGRLANDLGFCCLGVLCEIAVQDQVVIKRPDRDSGYGVTYVGKNSLSDEESAVLPVAVQDWAGLAGPNETVEIPAHLVPERVRNQEIIFNEDGSFNSSLADLNDTYRFTFREIAAVVKEVF